MMKTDYTLAERLEMTIGNIKFQENKVYWDDIEKLELILKALKKIEDGTYGYCEETMEPISIERLKARPIATLTLEAQENHEKNEKVYKEKEY